MRKNTKKEYVLGQPNDVSAEQIVKKAEEDGIKITKAYVYNIRSASKATMKSKKQSSRQLVRVAPLAKVKREEIPVKIDVSDRASDLIVQAIDAIIADRVQRVLSRLAVVAQ